MIKKILAAFLAYCAVCVIFIAFTGHMGDATTALYNATYRIVNASGFVIGGTASATTASPNFTAQIVDQNGTVLNPGTASGVSASPNLTIRVVDANGFVQSAIGGAAPTPTPTPAIVASGSSITTAVTLTGTTAGDTIICHVCSNTNTLGPAGPFTANISGVAFGGGPPYHYVLLHTVIPGDTSPYTTLASLGSFTQQVCVEVNHSWPGLDQISNWGAITSTVNNATVPTANGTTTFNNDTGIWLALIQGNTNDITTQPAGYTMQAGMHAAGTAGVQGCAIALKVNVGAVGTITVGNATASSATTTTATQIGFIQGFYQGY